MEQTKITYRGHELFTLGHFGTLIYYVLIFLFGVGWFAGGVTFLVENKGDLWGLSVGSCVVGLGIMFIAYIAMYNNIKESIDNRKLDKDIKLINGRLRQIKSAYKYDGESIHHIKDNSKESDVVVDNFVWNVFEKLLLETTSFSNSQITLLTKIYDGLELDSYDFLLENGLVKDKFLREQVVVPIIDLPEAKAGTKMIVRMKLDPPSFIPYMGDIYLCKIIDTNETVVVSEEKIEAV